MSGHRLPISSFRQFRSVLVQREKEGQERSKGRDSALRAGIFKAWGSIDPMVFDWAAQTTHRPKFKIIVSMSPSGYPSAELRPRSARFRFA